MAFAAETLEYLHLEESFARGSLWFDDEPDAARAARYRTLKLAGLNEAPEHPKLVREIYQARRDALCDGLARIVEYHERQDARFAEAAAGGDQEEREDVEPGPGQRPSLARAEIDQPSQGVVQRPAPCLRGHR